MAINCRGRTGTQKQLADWLHLYGRPEHGSILGQHASIKIFVVGKMLAFFFASKSPSDTGTCMM